MMTGTDRKEIEELLPWYAAGTLDAAENAKVEAALAADPALRTLLDLTRQEMGEAIALNEASGVPSSRALETLFARIEAEPARRAQAGRGLLDLGGRLADLFSPKALGWAAALAALAIIVETGYVTQTLQGQRDATYQTASAPQGQSAEGTFVMVGFQPGATAQAISGVLAEIGASIVDGPRPGGLYRVRLGAADLSRADAAQLSARLAGRKDVVRLLLPSS